MNLRKFLLVDDLITQNSVWCVYIDFSNTSDSVRHEKLQTVTSLRIKGCKFFKMYV